MLADLMVKVFYLTALVSFPTVQESPQIKSFSGFPGGSVVKNPPASVGDTGSIPGPGRFHMLQSN